jgi:hypothetical protein
MRSLFVIIVMAPIIASSVSARAYHRAAKRNPQTVTTNSAGIPNGNQRYPANASPQDQNDQPRVLTDGMGRH